MSTAASQPASKKTTAQDGRIGFGPVIIMGVSGSGKSSVGVQLAATFGCPFVEGDDLHPAANIQKMKAGTPLGDDDRWPWLDAVGRCVAQGDVVVSCSALKQSYRDRIRSLAKRPVTFLFLKGDRALLEARLARRHHEYMPATLLDSQMAALEIPQGGQNPEPDVIVVEIDQPMATIIARALAVLHARGSEIDSGSSRKEANRAEMPRS
jgi:gluconokinase